MAKSPKSSKVAAPKSSKVAKPAKQSWSMAVRETKDGRKYHCVSPSIRVEKDEFLVVLGKVKKMGGWYARQWQEQAGGFAFFDKKVAVEFAKANS